MMTEATETTTTPTSNFEATAATRIWEIKELRCLLLCLPPDEQHIGILAPTKPWAVGFIQK